MPPTLPYSEILLAVGKFVEMLRLKRFGVCGAAACLETLNRVDVEAGEHLGQQGNSANLKETWG